MRKYPELQCTVDVAVWSELAHLFTLFLKVIWDSICCQIKQVHNHCLNNFWATCITMPQAVPCVDDVAVQQILARIRMPRDDPVSLLVVREIIYLYMMYCYPHSHLLMVNECWFTWWDSTCSGNCATYHHQQNTFLILLQLQLDGNKAIAQLEFLKM